MGNVLATITDRRIQGASGNNIDIDTYTADIATAQDYYAFGMIQPGRVGHMVYDPATQTASWQQSAADYRYGFNGQEKSTEIDPNGNLNAAEFWEYDTRLGRRWNIDPVVKPWESSYAAFSDDPIIIADPDGDDGTKPTLTPEEAAEKSGYTHLGVKDVRTPKPKPIEPDKTRVGRQNIRISGLPTNAHGDVWHLGEWLDRLVEGRRQHYTGGSANYNNGGNSESLRHGDDCEYCEVFNNTDLGNWLTFEQPLRPAMPPISFLKIPLPKAVKFWDQLNGGMGIVNNMPDELPAKHSAALSNMGKMRIDASSVHHVYLITPLFRSNHDTVYQDYANNNLYNRAQYKQLKKKYDRAYRVGHMPGKKADTIVIDLIPY